ALTAALALACLGGFIASAAHGDWIWALVALVGAVLFAHELGGDIAERHHRHNTHPIVTDRPGSRPP
ncbi:hypothetical protein, partial [Streptomyces graminilatus]|uniref:hypothetical protein n=1 Tax=Streptomyces graminilatus TaxID=1464070 RepID=UPI0006E2A493